MPKQNKKILIWAGEETMGNAEFLDAFKKVLEAVLKKEKKLEEAIAEMRKTFTALQKKLGTDNTATSDNQNRTIKTELESLLRRFADKSKELDGKVSLLKDGKDADATEIVKDVLAQIKMPEQKELVKETLKQIPKQEEKILSIKDIKDLREELDKLKKKGFTGGGVMGRDLITDIDISSQLDGSTKTFNIQAIYKIISVDLSSFPHALRKNIDYTYTPTSITFTSEVDAGSLAKGQTCIITAVLS